MEINLRVNESALATDAALSLCGWHYDHPDYPKYRDKADAVLKGIEGKGIPPIYELLWLGLAAKIKEQAH